MNTFLSNVYNTTDEETFRMWFSKIQMLTAEELPYLGLFFRKGTLMTTADISGLGAVLETDTLRGIEFVERLD